MGCIKSKAAALPETNLQHPLIESNPLKESNLKSKETIPFPKHGVKVSFLNKFVEKYCGGRNKIQGWSTTDVNEKIVKPTSAASKLSFCDFLKSTDESSSVETAVVFISHGNYSRNSFYIPFLEN